MLMEASSGSWSKDAEKTLKIIIKGMTAMSGENISNISSGIFQSLSMILHRCYARAIIKRSPPPDIENVVKDFAAGILPENVEHGCMLNDSTA